MNNLALIIEDDPDLSTIFSEALKLAGFEIELIWDGKTALARLATVTPEVIALDLHLPHASGAEILAYIRSQPRLRQAQIILTTADERMAAELEQDKTHPVLVMIKPVSFVALRQVAKRLRSRA
jgi:CheY-like chemotaxis protein